MIRFQASALCCSGRPDPIWELPESTVSQLLSIWNDLPALAEEKAGSPPYLGYRGSLLIASNGEQWFAFSGAVCWKSTEGMAEFRQDRELLFEKMLLRSAPSSLLSEKSIQGFLQESTKKEQERRS
jgi:hypothetical protein